MTLTANPSNFFAETEQVAFHPGHLVPEIEVTNDPLLQARLFSYIDTQLTRLGGPNFNQMPINRPHVPVNDMLRDGFDQDAVHTGVAPYRPNSLGGGCPFTAGDTDGAFVQVPAHIAEGQKVRAAARSFDDHFSQVRLFYCSMSAVERDHIKGAYSFELSQCRELAVRQRQLQGSAATDRSDSKWAGDPPAVLIRCRRGEWPSVTSWLWSRPVMRQRMRETWIWLTPRISPISRWLSPST